MFISPELMSVVGPNSKFAAGFRRLLQNRQYETMGGKGIYVPRLSRGFGIGGIFVANVNGGPDDYSENLVPNAGLDHNLASWLLGGTQVGTWYIAPYTTNTSPAATWTGANFTANATEWVNYTPAARQTWTGSNTATGVNDNLAARAAFTSTVGAATIYGAGLLSTSPQSDVLGVLAAATLFTTSKAVTPPDVLNVGYVVTLTNPP